MLNKTIKDLEAKIKVNYEEHELSKIFSSLPGVGIRLSPRLLTLFGDNKERFASYQSVQAYAGTSPVTEQSGKSFYSVKIRRGCNKKFRNTLYQFSFCSISIEAWARDYYNKLRAKGHSHTKAIRSLSNKWVKIIYRMWKDGKTYDRNIFLEKRKKMMAA